jgi:uncharacterized protein
VHPGGWAGVQGGGGTEPGATGGTDAAAGQGLGRLAQALWPRISAAMAGDASGHDLGHVLRVRHLALRLAAAEGLSADGAEVVELVALLHDVGGSEGRADHGARGATTAAAWLEEEGAPACLVAEVAAAIATLSWSGGRTPPTLAGRVVQDADRLDALGAVGVARAFAFGGAHGQPAGLPVPGQAAAPARTTVAHFQNKLLRLAASLHTEAARALAVGRLAFLRTFLQRLAAEAEGVD